MDPLWIHVAIQCDGSVGADLVDYVTVSVHTYTDEDGCMSVVCTGHDGAAGKGRPQKKKGSGEEEDIYGGLGEGGEGIYDNASRGQAMRYSEDGLYDNPHGMGEYI